MLLAPYTLDMAIATLIHLQCNDHAMGGGGGRANAGAEPM